MYLLAVFLFSVEASLEVQATRYHISRDPPDTLLEQSLQTLHTLITDPQTSSPECKWSKYRVELDAFLKTYPFWKPQLVNSLWGKFVVGLGLKVKNFNVTLLGLSSVFKQKDWIPFFDFIEQIQSSEDERKKTSLFFMRKVLERCEDACQVIDRFLQTSAYLTTYDELKLYWFYALKDLDMSICCVLYIFRKVTS